MTPHRKPQSSRQQAANAFSGLFEFLGWARDWAKEHGLAVAVTSALVGGGTMLVNKCVGPQPAGAEKTTASLYNEAKLIATVDTLIPIVSQLAASSAAMQGRISAVDNKVDNIASDLIHLPEIRKIEQNRQDSIYKANRTNAFTFNLGALK